MEKKKAPELASEAFTHLTTRSQMSLRKMNPEKFWTISKDLIPEIGLDATFFLSLLVEKYLYNFNTGTLDDDEYFYFTLESISNSFKISPRQQRNIIDILKEKKLIDQVIKGMPARRYFKLIIENIRLYYKDSLNDGSSLVKMINKFSQNDQTGLVKMIKHACSKQPNTVSQNDQTNSLYIQNKNTDKEYKNKTTVATSDEKCASTHATSSIRATDPLKFNFTSLSFEGITDADLAGWKVAYPNVNLDSELAKMTEWIKSNPNKTKKLWRRFITTWLNRSQEREYNRGSYHSTARDRERSQFEIRHFGLQTDHSPRDPSMVLDCSNYKLGADGKWIPG